jgi:glycosyltransferase involved in cell wall biosynthesis
MSVLTVFTPTYNRAHTLPRTYQSLCNQTCKDFIWLIIDDGSSDNTRDLVKQWQSNDNGFEIRYIYKDNGGMHTAHNTAYENIDTELNVCIDSDDMFADGAVKKILEKWETVKGQGFAGIVGLDADMAGNLIGTGFATDMTETTLCGYYAAGGIGDKKLVYRTDVINAYPKYPVFSGEKYVALAYKYRLIDQDYKLAVLPEVLCHVEYQSDGSSKTMWKQYLNNPRGFAFWRKVCMQYPTTKMRMILDCIQYCSSSFISKNRNFIKESPRKLMTVICIIPGLVLAYITYRKVKR